MIESVEVSAGQRVGVVTGAARGIGLAIAERLAKDGVAVVGVDVEKAELLDAMNRLSRAGAAVAGLDVDLTSRSEVSRVVRRIEDTLGRIDILVNNAGITGPSRYVWEYGDEDWERVIELDLTATWRCSRYVLPGMIDRSYGRIVNVASVAGKEGNPKMAAYSAAKAGVIGFTKALAKEVATSGILVNAVTPAVVRTAILDELDDSTVEYMVERIPMKRTCETTEVAAMVSWLASDECSFSTGAVFDITGGRSTY